MPRAVRFDRYGDVDVLQVLDVPRPTLGPGQVLVRVRAASINPGESKIRTGALHDMFPATFPSGEGSDLAGIVEQVGDGVVEFAAGDEVVGWVDTRSSHAELVAVDAGHLTRKPPALAWEVAGAMFVAGTTAWAMVRAVSVAPGDLVLVAGATGGVGVLAVQLAKRAGAAVIGIAGDRHAAWLRERGVVPVRYGEGIEERIRQASREAGHEAPDALLDAHGGGYVELALGLGVATDRIDTIVDFPAVQRFGVKAEGSAAGARVEVLEELVGLAAAGRLELPIAASYPLDQVREAYRSLERDHPLGKIVLLP